MITNSTQQGIATTGTNVPVVRGNSIFGNTGLGIDLGTNGVTTTNLPVIASAHATGGVTTVTGTITAAASQTYQVDFYSSPTADGSGYGEGKVFLGTENVTTNGAGAGSFTFVSPIMVSGGDVVSALATQPGGTRSEFALSFTATETPITSVTLSSGNLLVEDSGGNTDQISITTSGTDYVITDTGGNNLSTNIAGATGDGTSTVTVPFAAVTGTQVIVNAGTGNDLVTIGGSFAPSNAGMDASQIFDLIVDGQVGSDTFVWSGSTQLASILATAEGINLNADASTAGSQNWIGPITLGANVVVSGSAVTFGNTIDGAFDLTTNDSGNTFFNGSVGTIAALTSLTTDAGGTTNFSGNTVTVANDITLGDAVLIDAPLTAINSTSGSVNLISSLNANPDAGGEQLLLQAGNNIVVNGSIGNNTALSQTVFFASQLTLNGGSINTTGLQNYVAPIVLGGNTTLSSSGGGNISFNDPINGASILMLNTSGEVTFAAGAGNVTPLHSVVTDAGGKTTISSSIATTTAQTYGDLVETTATLTLTSDQINTANVDIVGTLTVNVGNTGELSGTITGGGSLIKDGAGKLTLSGAGTYGGTTLVSAGSLAVTGSINSAVTVTAGATLLGNGSTGAVTAQNSSVIAPGNSPGILSTGDFDLQSSGTLEIEIGGTVAGNTASNHDQVDVSGTVTLAGSLSTSAFNSFVPTLGDTFTVVNNDGVDAVSGTFDGLAEGATIENFLGTGHSATISYVGGDGNDVVLTSGTAGAALARRCG